MRKLSSREMWNDCIGVVLCIVGLVGVHFKVEYSGWLIFFGFLFFCEISCSKNKEETAN